VFTEGYSSHDDSVGLKKDITAQILLV